MTDNKQNSDIELEIRIKKPEVKQEKPEAPEKNKKFFDPLKTTLIVILVATGLIWHFTTRPNEVAFDTIQATKQDNTNYSNPDAGKKPAELTNESKEKGAQAFTETCGGCHTAFGKGLGSIALEPRIAGLSADDILTVVKTSSNMFAVRSKPNLELIVNYLVKNSTSTTNNNPNGQPNVIKDNESKFFFYKACGKCHKVHGFGDGAEDLTKKAEALGVNGVLAAINNPSAEKMKLHLKGLTGPQKMAIARFVAGVTTNQGNNSRLNEGGLGIYENNFCRQCHIINGDGGSVGPELSHIGSQRSKNWLVKYLTNPKEVYPDTVMPVVPLTHEEIASLSQYLAAQK